ncbi:MAG: transposase [Acidobacteriota bacterium]
MSSYVGVTLSEHSSGDLVRHGHITPQGNPVVRSVPVESAWILLGKDPEMHRFYDRIKVRRGSDHDRLLNLLALPARHPTWED